MFSFVGGPYTASITKISAATMNYLRGILANAWDIIGGGTYTPTTQTELTGTIGLKTNFSATGLQVAGLGGLHILSGSTGYVDSGGFLTVSSGGVATITGTMTTSGAGAITIANGGDLFIASGGEETVQSGGLLTAAAGSTTTLNGAVTVGATSVVTFNASSSVTGTINLDASGNLVLNPARTFVRAVPGFKWVIGTTTISAERLAIPTSGTTAQPFTFVPNGATVTALRVQVDPAVNDGTLPATPAQLSLGRRNANGLGSTITANIGSFTSDSDASDAEHTITHTLAPAQVLDLETYEYFVCVSGEAGANAQVIDWISAKITYTMGTVPFG